MGEVVQFPNPFFRAWSVLAQVLRASLAAEGMTEETVEVLLRRIRPTIEACLDQVEPLHMELELILPAEVEPFRSAIDGSFQVLLGRLFAGMRESMSRLLVRMMLDRVRAEVRIMELEQAL